MRTFLVIGLMVLVALFLFFSGFTLPVAVSVGILVLALACDSYTTYRCLKVGAKEANPLIKFLFDRIGFRNTTILWWILWAVIITFYVMNAQPQTMAIKAVVYWIVPLNNLRVYVRILGKQKKASVPEQSSKQDINTEADNTEARIKEESPMKLKIYKGFGRDAAILIGLVIMLLIVRGM